MVTRRTRGRMLSLQSMVVLPYYSYYSHPPPRLQRPSRPKLFSRMRYHQNSKLHSYFIGTREMSVKPILRFFEPLRIWLYETNNANGDEPGWSGNGASTINFNKGCDSWARCDLTRIIHLNNKWLILGIFSPGTGFLLHFYFFWWKRFMLLMCIEYWYVYVWKLLLQ